MVELPEVNMKHFHGYIPLIAAILSVFPCCSDFGESPETSISFQHDRWKSFDLHSYSVIQLRGCFCPGPHMVSILVVRDTIADVINLSDSSEVLPGQWLPWHTIDGLFQLAEATKAGNPYRFTARFDPTYAYPTYLYVDPSGAVDDEFSYTTTSLIPL